MYVQRLLKAISSFRTAITINSYFLAFLGVLFVSLIQWFLYPILDGYSLYLIYLLAVLFASWHGGFFPGIVSIVLSIFSSGYFFTEPQLLYIFPQDHADVIRLILFTFVGLVVSLLNEARNTYERDRNALFEKEQTAKRLAIHQKMVREHFIAIASHELRSPLTSQKAFIQYLQRIMHENKHEEYARLLHKIAVQNDKLASFINDFLDISKMQTKKLQYTQSEFYLQDALATALDQVHSLLDKHTVTIKGGMKKPLYGDATRITQVFANLLTNAAKYSPTSNKIVIRIKRKIKYVEVSVQDFGIGIAKAHHKAVFQRFYRVDGSDQMHYAGYGLGLYLTAEIIRKHKGKLWLESEKGEGTTFYFTLPLQSKKRKS